MTRASIIIPTYNNADTLPRTLRCALDQDLEDVEIIVVNDAGTDPATFLDLSREDAARVTILNKARNAGVSAARNTGFAASTGETVLFLDADDLICRDFLRLGRDALDRHPGAGVAVGEVLIIPEADAPARFASLPQSRASIELDLLDPAAFVERIRLRRVDFKTNGTLCRRDCLRDITEATLWREDLKNSEDTHLLMRIAMRHGCAFLHEPVGIYVRRGGSLSANPRASWTGRVAAMDMMLAEYPALGEGDRFRYAVRRMRNNGARQLARLCAQAGDRTACRSILWEDMRRFPNYKSLLFYLRYGLMPA